MVLSYSEMRWAFTFGYYSHLVRMHIFLRFVQSLNCHRSYYVGFQYLKRMFPLTLRFLKGVIIPAVLLQLYRTARA